MKVEATAHDITQTQPTPLKTARTEHQEERVAQHDERARLRSELRAIRELTETPDGRGRHVHVKAG